MSLPPGAAGATAIFETARAVGNEAIREETAEEIESLHAGAEAERRNLNRAGNASESPSKIAKTQKDDMSKHLKTASENVIVENTRAEYRR
jgi:hypothetical protein